MPVTQIPPLINPNLSGTVGSAKAASTPGSEGVGDQLAGVTEQVTAAAGRNGERSVAIVDQPAKTVDPKRDDARTDRARSVDRGPGVEERADSDRPRKMTGISEHELAELIQSGDPSRIKAALSRMTPEMRRVAEAVVAESGG